MNFLIQKREPLSGQTKVVCKEVAWTCDDKHLITSIYLVKSKEYQNKIKVWTREGALKHQLNVRLAKKSDLLSYLILILTLTSLTKT